MKVLVLDSSPEPPNNRELQELVSKENVNWKRYDPEVFFVNKLADGCKFIETEFAVLSADDDFLIITGIIESLQFLLDHTDYTSAHGRYFAHTSAEEAHRTGAFGISPLYTGGQSAEQETGAERIHAYLSGQTCCYPFYAVHRTPILQKVWSETKEYVSDYGLSELFPCSLSLAYGKMKLLSVFYCSREPNTFNPRSEDRRRAEYSKTKVDNAVRGIVKHLCYIDSVSREKAESMTRDSLDAYFARGRKKSISCANISISLWQRVKDKLKIRTRLAFLLYKGCHPSIWPDYFGDYKKIRDFVISAGLTAEELNCARDVGEHSEEAIALGARWGKDNSK